MSLDVSSPPHRIATQARSFPVRRRITTYFTGGIDGLQTLSATLQQPGYKVHDLSVDIHDGVRESSMVCTVLLPDGDVEPLLDRLRGLPAVVSSELL